MAVSAEYGLFSFFEENTLGVGPLSLVSLRGSQVRPNTLTKNIWDKETEVLVRWGKDLYPAKILDISDNEQSVLKRPEELLKDTLEDEECGRGRRRKKTINFSSSEEEEEQAPPRKKGISCSNCKQLTDRLLAMERDNQRLIRQLDAIHDLKHMLKACAPPASQPLQSAPPASQPLQSAPLTAGQTQDPSSDDMVIGEGIVVSRTKVMRCNHSSPSKLACDLLSVLYTRRELATMSLTGQKGSAKEAVKPPLPPNVLNAIFEYALQKFPGADVATLRGAVRNKLNNESKVFKK
ncbi:hypothetical protein ACEWY4_006129 [Coilia grayii]|uniref:BEN domain-containing protein n=1 Tax=Coilia grayii TaxID=363190 RepID=A0ABD1KCK8_9TELE